MSTSPTVVKALVTAFWSVTSATKVRTVVPVCVASMSSFALRSVLAVRPEMATVEAPAAAKARAVARPIPAPPPVTKTVLPEAEREGLVGEMAG